MPTPALAGGVDPSSHIAALDGVRGLAILLVIWGHLTIMNPFTSVDVVYTHLSQLGWCGVDLFFVLSGFLITGILLDAKGSEHYYRNYYVRRILRIFPLYYGVVFFALVFLPRVMPWVMHTVASQAVADQIAQKINNFGRVTGEEWYYWLHISNIPIARRAYMHGILDVSWSLAIEEQFYLVWPTLVFMCTRKTLMRLCGVMFVAAMGCRAVLVLAFPQYHVAPYVLTPCRMDSLGIGAFIACVARGPGGIERLVPLARWVLPIGLLGAIGLSVYERLLGHYDQVNMGAGMGPICMVFIYSLFGPAFGALLVLSAVSRPGTVLNRAMTNTFMRSFGKYAYALYLFHHPLRALVRDTLYGPMGYGGRFKFLMLFGSELPGQIIFYFIAVPIAFGAAWLSWRFYEAPILRLKRFFPSGAEEQKAKRLGRGGPA